MIKDCDTYLATKKNLIKPSHYTRKPYQKEAVKHRYNLKTLNITPVEIDCVKWYSLFPHSSRTLKPSLGKPF